MGFDGSVRAHRKRHCAERAGSRREPGTPGTLHTASPLWHAEKEARMPHYYAPNKIGEDTIWHSARHPSVLILPVV